MTTDAGINNDTREKAGSFAGHASSNLVQRRGAVPACDCCSSSLPSIFSNCYLLCVSLIVILLL